MSFAGTRKHLNLLVQDYGMSTKRSSIRGSTKTDHDEQMAQIIEEEKAKKSFEPPYIVGGTHARDIARMVNARRTPSGNFFQVTNPSLAPTVMECRNQRHKSFADLYRTKAGGDDADTMTVGGTAEAPLTASLMSTAGGEGALATTAAAEGEGMDGDGTDGAATRVRFDDTAAAASTMGASRTRSWDMPSLINDRENGARVAKLVASKRTPTGGFYASQH